MSNEVATYVFIGGPVALYFFGMWLYGMWVEHRRDG